MAVFAPDNRLYVVVGVLTDKNGRVFIQQRRQGTAKAGKWEFPGGKLEHGEMPPQGLARELREELDIDVIQCQPLTTIAHDYDHARVWLDTYLVTEFEGRAIGHEGQSFAWTDIDQIIEFNVLPPVFAIVDALKLYRSS